MSNYTVPFGYSQVNGNTNPNSTNPGPADNTNSSTHSAASRYSTGNTTSAGHSSGTSSHRNSASGLSTVSPQMGTMGMYNMYGNIMAPSQSDISAPPEQQTGGLLPPPSAPGMSAASTNASQSSSSHHHQAPHQQQHHHHHHHHQHQQQQQQQHPQHHQHPNLAHGGMVGINGMQPGAYMQAPYPHQGVNSGMPGMNIKGLQAGPPHTLANMHHHGQTQQQQQQQHHHPGYGHPSLGLGPPDGTNLNAAAAAAAAAASITGASAAAAAAAAAAQNPAAAHMSAGNAKMMGRPHMPYQPSEEASAQVVAAAAASGIETADPQALLHPTYIGHIKTAVDAILLLSACDHTALTGKAQPGTETEVADDGLPRPKRVTRRLLDGERASLIHSGSIFVWDEKEAGMRRWTDGRCWSASRVSGCFLTYRELEGKKKTPAQAALIAAQTGKPSTGGTSNTYKLDGLIKQSFSITTLSGRKLHIISYYTKRDIRENRLRKIHEDPHFRRALINSADLFSNGNGLSLPLAALPSATKKPRSSNASTSGAANTKGKGGASNGNFDPSELDGGVLQWTNRVDENEFQDPTSRTGEDGDATFDSFMGGDNRSGDEGNGGSGSGGRGAGGSGSGAAAGGGAGNGRGGKSSQDATGNKRKRGAGNGANGASNAGGGGGAADHAGQHGNDPNPNMPPPHLYGLNGMGTGMPPFGADGRPIPGYGGHMQPPISMPYDGYPFAGTQNHQQQDHRYGPNAGGPVPNQGYAYGIAPPPPPPAQAQQGNAGPADPASISATASRSGSGSSASGSAFAHNGGAETNTTAATSPAFSITGNGGSADVNGAGNSGKSSSKSPPTTSSESRSTSASRTLPSLNSISNGMRSDGAGNGSGSGSGPRGLAGGSNSSGAPMNTLPPLSHPSAFHSGHSGPGGPSGAALSLNTSSRTAQGPHSAGLVAERPPLKRRFADGLNPLLSPPHSNASRVSSSAGLGMRSHRELPPLSRPSLGRRKRSSSSGELEYLAAHGRLPTLKSLRGDRSASPSGHGATPTASGRGRNPSSDEDVRLPPLSQQWNLASGNGGSLSALIARGANESSVRDQAHRRPRSENEFEQGSGRRSDEEEEEEEEVFPPRPHHHRHHPQLVAGGGGEPLSRSRSRAEQESAVGALLSLRSAPQSTKSGRSGSSSSSSASSDGDASTSRSKAGHNRHHQHRQGRRASEDGAQARDAYSSPPPQGGGAPKSSVSAAAASGEPMSPVRSLSNTGSTSSSSSQERGSDSSKNGSIARSLISVSTADSTPMPATPADHAPLLRHHLLPSGGRMDQDPQSRGSPSSGLDKFASSNKDVKVSGAEAAAAAVVTATSTAAAEPSTTTAVLEKDVVSSKTTATKLDAIEEAGPKPALVDAAGYPVY
ncbi:Gluconate transport-inducing protein [Tilletia horrida]|nr:Gluconate transport-inducing protein [Tilletia horrida]